MILRYINIFRPFTSACNKSIKLLCLAFFVGHFYVQAQPMVLDSSFHFDGITTHSVGSNNDNIDAILIQTDEKIVAVGKSYIGNKMICAITRYLSNGQLDGGFGNSGIVLDSIGSSHSAFHDVAQQTDGKIVAVGHSTANFLTDFGLMRFLTNGDVDSTFGLNGKVVTDFFGGDDDAWSIAIQPDGKIIAAGICRNPQQPSDFAAARYLPNGTLDTTFGTGGKTKIAIGPGNDFATSCALLPDGKLLLAGHSLFGNVNDFSIARINANGTLDSTFGVHGSVITSISPLDEGAYGLAVQADGKIILTGFAIITSPYYKFAVLRYLPNGTLDSTFGTFGIQITSFGAYNDYPSAVVLQANGKIIVGGSSSTGLQNDMALARYNTNGSLDTTFGTGGKLITAVSSGFESIYSLKIQPDGKLVCGGFAQQSGNAQFALLRYKEVLNIGAIEFTQHPKSVFVYPNPVAQNAMLCYELQGNAEITVTLHDLSGKVVTQFFANQHQQAGRQRFPLFLGDDLASGMYILRLSSSEGCFSIKISKE